MEVPGLCSGLAKRAQAAWSPAVPARCQETVVGADTASVFGADETFPELSPRSQCSCPKSTAEALCEQHHRHK